MPRFVLLKHSLPPVSLRDTHWDFMLEADGVLQTWALAEQPVPDREIAATKLAAHRLAYLEYEGPISADRGSVVCVDRGEYTRISEAPECLEVTLCGAHLRGRATLSKPNDDQRWRFVLRAEADFTAASMP